MHEYSANISALLPSTVALAKKISEPGPFDYSLIVIPAKAGIPQGQAARSRFFVLLLR